MNSFGWTHHHLPTLRVPDARLPIWPDLCTLLFSNFTKKIIQKCTRNRKKIEGSAGVNTTLHPSGSASAYICRSISICKITTKDSELNPNIDSAACYKPTQRADYWDSLPNPPEQVTLRVYFSFVKILHVGLQVRTFYDILALLNPFWCCKNGSNVNNVTIGHCDAHDRFQVH